MLSGEKTLFFFSRLGDASLRHPTIRSCLSLSLFSSFRRAPPDPKKALQVRVDWAERRPPCGRVDFGAGVEAEDCGDEVVAVRFSPRSPGWLFIFRINTNVFFKTRIFSSNGRLPKWQTPLRGVTLRSRLKSGLHISEKTPMKINIVQAENDHCIFGPFGCSSFDNKLEFSRPVDANMYVQLLHL